MAGRATRVSRVVDSRVTVLTALAAGSYKNRAMVGKMRVSKLPSLQTCSDVVITVWVKVARGAEVTVPRVVAAPRPAVLAA